MLGWLTKLAALITLFGLVAFDGIALVKTNFAAADHANTAASAAADVYKGSKNVQSAYDAAVAVVEPSGDTIDPKTFLVDPTSGHVTLTVVEPATTLWLYRIAPLKKYTLVHATGEGNPAQ